MHHFDELVALIQTHGLFDSTALFGSFPECIVEVGKSFEMLRLEVITPEKLELVFTFLSVLFFWHHTANRRVFVISLMIVRGIELQKLFNHPPTRCSSVRHGIRLVNSTRHITMRIYWLDKLF